MVRDVDTVLDTVGGDTLERSWGVVRRDGVIVTTAGSISEGKAEEYGVCGISFIVRPSREQLMTIGKLVDGGVVRPTVSAVFPLADARKAFERGATGHNPGKIVLSVHSAPA